MLRGLDSIFFFFDVSLCYKSNENNDTVFCSVINPKDSMIQTHLLINKKEYSCNLFYCYVNSAEHSTNWVSDIPCYPGEGSIFYTTKWKTNFIQLTQLDPPPSPRHAVYWPEKALELTSVIMSLAFDKAAAFMYL